MPFCSKSSHGSCVGLFLLIEYALLKTYFIFIKVEAELNKSTVNKYLRSDLDPLAVDPKKSGLVGLIKIQNPNIPGRSSTIHNAFV